MKSVMHFAFSTIFIKIQCVSVRISGENPRSVRRCPVCLKSRTPDTLGQLAAVPLIILIFCWRCCDDYSPRKSILGTRTSSRCSLDGVILHATFNDFGAKCKYCYFNNQKRLRRPFLEKKPVERPKVSGLSDISDTGHSWVADRRPADHFGLWLEALR